MDKGYLIQYIIIVIVKSSRNTYINIFQSLYLRSLPMLSIKVSFLDEACDYSVFFLGEFTILSLLPRVWMEAVSVESKFKLTGIETIVSKQLIITLPFSLSTITN